MVNLSDGGPGSLVLDPQQVKGSAAESRESKQGKPLIHWQVGDMLGFM